MKVIKNVRAENVVWVISMQFDPRKTQGLKDNDKAIVLSFRYGYFLVLHLLDFLVSVGP